jgi:hypothetical protein
MLLLSRGRSRMLTLVWIVSELRGKQKANWGSGTIGHVDHGKVNIPRLASSNGINWCRRDAGLI